MKLLSIESDAKTSKSIPYGYRTAILYLAPASLSGFNVCPHSTPGCRAACLYTAGRGIQEGVQTARLARTLFYRYNRAGFLNQLQEEIKAHIVASRKRGLVAAVRLNGTSDIDWSGWNIPAMFPEARFYDYTKSAGRAIRWLGTDKLSYHLTLSSSENDRARSLNFLRWGGNLAVVFRLHRSMGIPTRFAHDAITEGESFNVIDGEKHDLRFLDAPGCIVGLRAKGRARRDDSGFVVNLI